ncbi:MAG: hypothetical protein DSY83_06960 [Flavobacteriia bacterium]|nr:MAG: hypothetical protein DSY83_06960 [Flavobacteriia bacterium]
MDIVKTQRKLCLFFLMATLFVHNSMMAQRDTLSILHVSDLHVIFNPYAHIPEMMEYRKKKDYHLGESRFRNFLATIPDQTESDLVIATGDLVDFFESRTVDSSITDIQPREFSKLLRDYPTPVLLTLGNHDVFTFDWAENRDYKLLHNQNHVGRARSLWVKNLPCFSEGTYYSKTLQVGKTMYRLIFIDDSFYQFHNNDESKNVPYIDKAQLYWFKDQLNASKDDVEVVFMHIPFGIKSTEKNLANDFFQALGESASLKLIFAGHHHKNIVKTIKLPEGHEIVQVQTGALVNDPNNWRVIRLTEQDIKVSLPGQEENELVIKID